MSNSEELYKWINERYEMCMNGDITEEEYLKDLEEYKIKIGQEEAKQAKEKKQTQVSKSKVRSTSIAGLRSKLLDELKKD